MKKLLLAFLLLVGSVCVTNAQQVEPPANWFQIVFQVQHKKPFTNGVPVPKSPATPPTVYLDGHTLYIDSIGCDSYIELTDEYDNVVCSVFVPDGTTTVVLPSTLTGTYGLSLIPETGDYYYYSEVLF